MGFLSNYLILKNNNKNNYIFYNQLFSCYN